MRRTICSCVLLIIFYSNLTYANDEELTLYAQSAVLMDGESGRILYDKEGEEALPNASTTKILTCILALEYGDMDATIVASAEAASQPAVHLGVLEGEEYYLQDLLYALMLESYNDSAVMIAESISGSVEEFAVLMNEKAKEIGCEDSYFITPNGLDAQDEEGEHHTTASDLALIMKYCIYESPMKEEFLEITQTQSYSFQDTNGSRYFTCSNRNALLQTNEDAISGKTGFTNNAGYCYVGVIENEGRTFIVALLGCGWPYNSGYKWVDCETLFQYGMDNFYYELIESSSYSGALEEVLENVVVEGGKTLESIYTTNLTILESAPVEMLMSEEEELEIKLDYSDVLYAPMKENTLVGGVSYYLGEMLVKVDSIIVEEEIEAESFSWTLYKKLYEIIGES